MKPIKSSEMPVLFTLLGMLAFADIVVWIVNGNPRQAYIFTVWETVMLIALYPRWVVYYITPEGFQRKYLGLFPMKDISWKDIRDVERIPARNCTLLLVSTVNVRYPMPDRQKKKSRNC